MNKIYLTEIHKVDGLYAGNPVEASSFKEAENVVALRGSAEKVIGEFICEVGDKTTADSIINNLNKDRLHLKFE